MKTKFLNTLYLIPNKNETFIVGKNFNYFSNVVNEIITVPTGFKTDLTSSPRIFWSLIPPFGNYTRISVIHDYLYYTKKYPRNICDNIFKEGLEISNVNKFKIFLLYYAVKIFGKKHYKGKK